MVARALILVAMMAAAGVYAAGASGDEVPVTRTPLSELPATIEAWHGRDTRPFDDDVVAALGVDDYINRHYERNGGPSVALYVGYYASQRQGDTIHSPQNCLPGAGWRPVSSERVTIDAGGTPIEVNRYLIRERRRAPGGPLLVSGARPGRGQRVREQAVADARRRAPSPHERRARASHHARGRHAGRRVRRIVSVHRGGVPAPGGTSSVTRVKTAGTVMKRACLLSLEPVSKPKVASGFSRTSRVLKPLLASLVVVALAGTGCSRDPVARAQKYVASGDEYAKKNQRDEAVIQYRQCHQDEARLVGAALQARADVPGRRRSRRTHTASTRAPRIWIRRTWTPRSGRGRCCWCRGSSPRRKPERSWRSKRTRRVSRRTSSSATRTRVSTSRDRRCGRSSRRSPWSRRTRRPGRRWGR